MLKTLIFDLCPFLPAFAMTPHKCQHTWSKCDRGNVFDSRIWRFPHLWRFNVLCNARKIQSYKCTSLSLWLQHIPLTTCLVTCINLPKIEFCFISFTTISMICKYSKQDKYHYLRTVRKTPLTIKHGLHWFGCNDSETVVLIKLSVLPNLNKHVMSNGTLWIVSLGKILTLIYLVHLSDIR